MKIAVAMSGGVDSSVAAALLKQQGHELSGITMRLFEPFVPGAAGPVHDAAEIARQLGIPHHQIDLEPDFRRLIIDDFVHEYRCGQTPNPCVRCNRFVKFGLLLDKARQLGADMLATGHYARKTVDPDGGCHLRMARNIRKDQSYFLHVLSRERLEQVLFPLGDVESKDEVRQLARQFGLTVATKSDSQEVCFIPNDDYVAYLENREQVPAVKGEIVHLNGKRLGTHNGTHRFTIGQRRGLGVAWSEPLYVTALDAARNLVIAGEERHVFARGLLAAGLNWINPPSSQQFESTCKIRYRHQPVACRVRVLEDGGCRVEFHEPQKAVTPGQSVVFYQDDEVLGGGRIQSAIGNTGE